MKDYRALFHYLLSASEADWAVEFKLNFDKERDGKNISALANTAVLKWRDHGYIVYGIEDGTKTVIGTTFNPNTAKAGNQPIKIWLDQKLSPKVGLEFYCFQENGRNIVIVEIEAAKSIPVKFDTEAYVKIWESTTLLRDRPNLEQKIWNNDKNKNFEKGKAMEGLSFEQVLQFLDYDIYFQLTKQELPTETVKFVEKLIQEKCVIKEKDNTYSITVLWALLFARNLKNFDVVKRKGVRVITYKGNSKLERRSEIEGERGYASAFENLMWYIIQQSGNNEIITQSVRIDSKKYPPLALREFIANALIHQDFSISWAGPLIEIFDNRIEITNPWIPLIDTERFIDHPPRSRNEDVASLMRRLGFCEESGSGIDRALTLVELYQLPAPKFETYDEFTKTTLFASKLLKDMSEEDKIRACYQHCVLLYLKGEEKMQNASLRKRFNISEKNYSMASRIIKISIERGKIKLWEKPKEYVPWRA